ncbi:hypothetical protein A0J61_09650 [Choanephora cucurbitarum]|uniref:Uncharacterized protein n=1 Tax=Choanephora cucurbitarum TaxID=101091 RepID=A0A1C7N0Z2_9FUNG|nr:hypothetical protein A0J61_09650 [Choanephora cucurbitarum]
MKKKESKSLNEKIALEEKGSNGYSHQTNYSYLDHVFFKLLLQANIKTILLVYQIKHALKSNCTRVCLRPLFRQKKLVEHEVANGEVIQEQN